MHAYCSVNSSLNTLMHASRNATHCQPTMTNIIDLVELLFESDDCLSSWLNIACVDQKAEVSTNLPSNVSLIESGV